MQRPTIHNQTIRSQTETSGRVEPTKDRIIGVGIEGYEPFEMEAARRQC